MPNIKVKQLGERVSTQGVHFGLGPATRKLEPGEIVYLDQESPLFERVYETGTVEITTQKPTRPLTYEDAREARYCSPTFRPRDESERLAAAKARETVATRVKYVEQGRAGTIAAAQKAAEKRAEAATEVEVKAEEATEPTIADVKQERAKKVDNRRAKRRQQLEEEKRGEANTA